MSNDTRDVSFVLNGKPCTQRTLPGETLMETLNELELQVPVVRVGWPDAFIEHGKVESLREKYGLTAEAALEKARPYLTRMMDHVLAKH